MNRLRRITRAFTPSRIALGLSLFLAIYHLILFGTSVRRLEITKDTQRQLERIKGNLENLEEMEQQAIQDLRDELAFKQRELESLQTSFPRIGAPFQFYPRGQELALSHDVLLTAVRRQETESAPTVVGDVQTLEYLVESSAMVENCLVFLGALEDAGLGSISVHNISLDPGGARCGFTVRTIGLPGALQP